MSPSYTCFILSLFTGFLKADGSLPSKDCLLNVGLFITLVLQLTAALVYQWISISAGTSQNLSGGLIFESLCFSTYSFYYLLFLLLKISGLSLYPVHWLTLIGIYSKLDSNVHNTVCAEIFACKKFRQWLVLRNA